MVEKIIEYHQFLC